MGRPLLPILLLCLLLVGPSVPFVWGAGITSQTISSSTASPCLNCISTNVTQIVPYSIKPGQFGQDLGFFNTSTSLAGFSWSGLEGTALTFGLPTGCLPSGILYNSSLTSLGCGTTAFYFKPQNYQSLITIRGVSTGLPVCIPISGLGGQITYNANVSSTRAQLGGSILDWSDIPASMNPAFSSSQLCYTPPIGPYSIDPLAIDGTGSCANANSNTCNMTLTTANANDIIIVISTSVSGGGVGGFALPTSTGLTFHNRVQVCAGFTCASVSAIAGMSEDYAVSTGTLSSATVTCTQTGNTNARISCVTYGISGASTTTPFDTNGALPCTGNSASTATTGSCVLSTSNANDIIIGSRVVVGTPSGNTYSGITTAAKCNAGDTAGSACSGYVVVSSTQSSLTVSISWTGAGAWAFIGDALQQAASAVTQGIKITTLTAGAPSCSIGISGGGASNSSFTADGSTHSYSLSASATITLTVTTGANARCAWNVSPHPTYSATITFTTCASGTCSTYSNNSYYQTTNLYTLNPLTPSTWDGIYTTSISGTFLGAAGTSTAGPNTAAGGGSVSIGAGAAPISPQTIATSTSVDASVGAPNHGIFFVENLWWYFYSDNTHCGFATWGGASGWSGFTALGSQSCVLGWYLGVEYSPSGKFCYDIINVAVAEFFWRCGNLTTSGTINFDGSETTTALTNVPASGVAETSIQNDTGGNIWVGAETKTGGGIFHDEFWETTNNGVSWTKQLDVTGARDPLVLKLNGGHIAAVYPNNAAGSGPTCVQVWNGATFSAGSCTAESGVSNSLQNSASSLLGTTVVIALGTNVGASPVNFYSCADPCNSMSSATQIVSASTNNWMNIATDNSSTVQVTWTDSATPTTIDFSVSTNSGSTWGATQTLSTGETSMVSVNNGGGALFQNGFGCVGIGWNAGSSPYNVRFAGQNCASLTPVWYDYNTAVSAKSPIGNTWVAQAPSSFTDITGGNSHLVNYIQSSGTGGGASTWLWMLTIPFFLVGIVLLGKRRRLRI